MCKLDVVRAWKDEDYRMSLSDAERRVLPMNPAGLIEISDSELGAVGGGTDGWGMSCFGLCNSEYFQICSGWLGNCGNSAGLYYCPILPLECGGGMCY